MTGSYIFVRYGSCIPCAGAHVTPMCGILVQCAPILVHFSFLVTPKTWESFSHVSQIVRNLFLTTKSRTYPVDNLCLSVSQIPYKIYMRNFVRRDCISLRVWGGHTDSIMSLSGIRVRHACVSDWIHCAISHVLHYIWRILRVSRGTYHILWCMYALNIQHIVTYHILTTICCVLYSANRNM